MDEKQKEESNCANERLQNILNNFSKCKMGFIKESEECRKLKEMNSKLEVELKEARDLEKSHRNHLVSSREMIAYLQETVSHLVYLKRDVKKLKDEIAVKETAINTIEKEKENITRKHCDVITELKTAHDQEIMIIMKENESRIQQMQTDSDTKIAHLTCEAEELRSKIREMEAEHGDKTNILVLDYEEKMQRQASQITQLQEQLARQTARTDANIDAYRRKLENLEEKLKQSQFKEYLSHSTRPSQYEATGERPYSVEREYPAATYSDTNTYETPKPQNRQQNKLQVMYCEEKPNTEKEGRFNITKRRKLYTQKDHLN